MRDAQFVAEDEKVSERVNVPPAIDPLIDLAVPPHRSTSLHSLPSPFPLLALDFQVATAPRRLPFLAPLSMPQTNESGLDTLGGTALWAEPPADERV
jgi:hypothetical protein